MRKKDTFDVMTSIIAIVGDALAIYGGFMLATWIRFDTGLIPMFHDAPSRDLYLYGAGVATILFLFIFRSLELYQRPQLGSFGDKIPRLVRACGWGILLSTALAFILRTDPPFSRITVMLSFITITVLVLLERFLLFRLEHMLALQRKSTNRVLIIGTDSVAARAKAAIESEPLLRSDVVAFLTTFDTPSSDELIPETLIKGSMNELDTFLSEERINQVILADNTLPHERMVEIIVTCERGLVPFYLIPDLFSVLTSKVHVDHIKDLPLLGVDKWPLDLFWHRILKRMEDILGAMIGLLVSIPIIFISALVIKKTSPGPVFYKQVRCGEGGREFAIYKLRTMHINAEAESGPVWANENDSRRTHIGAFLREYNLDETPQFWNVLKGEMSLVGPRPERPHFVEQFKEDISRYMWRHVSKPGITGWAQVNGLRGNTSIQDRIKYDLFYLENWSLAFDFKILIKTFFTRKNAY